MVPEKKALSAEQIDAQAAFELPDREMMALVNVALGNTVVAVPIGIAANVCGVDANVLAQQAQQGTPSCTATNTTSPQFQNLLSRIGQA